MQASKKKNPAEDDKVVEFLLGEIVSLQSLTLYLVLLVWREKVKQQA